MQIEWSRQELILKKTKQNKQTTKKKTQNKPNQPNNKTHAEKLRFFAE